MSTITITLPRPRIGRLTLVGAACALAGAGAAAAAFMLSGSSAAPATQVYTAPSHAFTLTVPHGWRAAAQPGALAVVRSRDGRAAVVVSPGVPLRGDMRSATKQITALLRRRFAGFRQLGAREISTRAGTAYLYSFVRGSVVQSVAVVGVAGRTYLLNAIVASGAADRAREAGAIVGSFGG
jgi:hypothetical protein